MSNSQPGTNYTRTAKLLLAAFLLLVGIAGTARALHSDFGDAAVWTQVTGNATTSQATDCKGTPAPITYCGPNVTLTAEHPYYLVTGAVGTTGPTRAELHNPSGFFISARRDMLESPGTNAPLVGATGIDPCAEDNFPTRCHVVYQTNTSASTFWGVYRFVPDETETDVAMWFQDGLSGQGESLTGWTVTGTDNLAHIFTYGGQPVAYLFDMDADVDPPIVTATPGNGRVTLNWTAIPAADWYTIWSETTAAGCTNLAGDYDEVGNTTSTSFVHEGIPNGIRRYYCVRAVDGPTFTGENSAEVNATPWYAPNLVGTLGTRAAALSWDTGGWTNPTNFTLYRGTEEHRLTPYRTLLGEARGYNDEIDPGARYYYAVTVTNATNTSARSNEVSVASPTLFTWEGNYTRIEPDAVYVFVNRTFQEDYWLDIVRFDPRTGTPRGDILAAVTWPTTSPANLTFRWPQYRPSNATVDAGTYHVYVVDAAGTYLDGRNICISAASTWPTQATCNSRFVLDDGGKAGIAAETRSEATDLQAAQDTAQQRATAQTYLTRGLSFFMGSSFGLDLPNIFLLDLVALLLVAISLLRGRSG